MNDKKTTIELSDKELNYLFTSLAIAEAATAKVTYVKISNNFPLELKELIKNSFLNNREKIISSMENLTLAFIVKDRELSNPKQINKFITNLRIPKDLFVEFVEKIYSHKESADGPKFTDEIHLSHKMRETIAYHAAESYKVKIHNCMDYYLGCIGKKQHSSSVRIIEANYAYVAEVKEDKTLTFMLAEMHNNKTIQKIIATHCSYEFLPFLFGINNLEARNIIKLRILQQNK